MSNFIISPWIQIPLLFIIISLSSSLSSSATTHKHANKLSYSTHCNLAAPESVTDEEALDVIIPPNPFFSISGGTPFLGQNSSKTVSFRRFKAYETSSDGVIKVEVTLSLIQKRNNDFYYAYDNYTSDSSGGYRRGVLRFRLSGYLYEETGDLCMVGYGSGHSGHGDSIDKIPAVFKMHNLRKNSSIGSSLITATLESLSSVSDSSYFQQISLLMFHEMKYEYSLVSKEIGNGGFDRINDVSKSLPLPSEPRGTFCMFFSFLYQFELVYPSTCDSAKNCTPFDSKSFFPRGITFSSIECDNEDPKLRLLVKFTESSYDYDYLRFDPKTTLIGEGVWDGKKNQLQIVACKILSLSGSSKNARVGDCSIRLTLRFPATLSIRDSSYIRGNIWSSKPANDSEYFNKIEFKASQSQGAGIHVLKYEYTQIDKVGKLCTPAKITNKRMKDTYPDGNSYDMSFDISVKTHYGNSIYGYAMPLYVGDHIYERNGYAIYEIAPSSDTPTPLLAVKKNSSLHQVPVNISYTISFSKPSSVWLNASTNSTYNSPLYLQKFIEISAEGIYDPRTGGLCMIGCKKIGAESQPTIEKGLDCEIVIKFQLPSLNSKNSMGGFIKGSIESMRKNNDSLYFERLELTSSAYIASVASDNIWRMDFEIILVLVSNTLACVFVAIQLFYVKKHPQTLPFASLTMLAILSLSYMLPLLLNFEALFMPNHDRQNVSLENGKWIEVNEVLVRVITMVTFLLQFRLLQSTWSSRVKEKMSLWAPEKKGVLYVLIPMYIVGAIVTCILNWQKDGQQQLLGDLKSYAGLILDGFLLPQILLNIFCNTKEKTLSVAYYVGTTFVRLLPHAYDLYRASSDQNAGRFERSYMYGNHGVDFYSVAWDVTIPCVALVFAAIIFLQQRFGGRFVLPRRFREGEDYEKVSVVAYDL